MSKINAPALGNCSHCNVFVVSCKHHDSKERKRSSVKAVVAMNRHSLPLSGSLLASIPETHDPVGSHLAFVMHRARMHDSISRVIDVCPASSSCNMQNLLSFLRVNATVQRHGFNFILARQNHGKFPLWSCDVKNRCALRPVRAPTHLQSCQLN